MIEEIITDVMEAEGWDKYTDHPNDRGGPTKWGITLKAWGEWRGHDITADDVKEITEPQAREFYEKLYVIGPKFSLLPNILVPMVVDCGVNHGVSRASKWIQRAVEVTEDGEIGPKTLKAVGLANPISTYLKVCSYRTSFYGRIITDDPSQAVFAAGWNNRAAKWLERLAQYITGG